MKTYSFPIVLCGDGKNVQDAWQDACEAFGMDPGCAPVEGEYEIIDNDGEDEGD